MNSVGLDDLMDSKIAVRMGFSHDGIDTGCPLKSGLMAKFRLETMAENHFFLTIKVETEQDIPFGEEGVLKAVLLGHATLTEEITPGKKLLVYGLPNQRVGTATVDSVALV